MKYNIPQILLPPPIRLHILRGHNCIRRFHPSRTEKGTAPSGTGVCPGRKKEDMYNGYPFDGGTLMLYALLRQQMGNGILPDLRPVGERGQTRRAVVKAVRALLRHARRMLRGGHLPNPHPEAG